MQSLRLYFIMPKFCRGYDMALVRWPDDINITQEVRCIICAANKPLHSVTAAHTTKQDEQLFVCSGHFWNTSQLIMGFCDYALQQKQQARAKRTNLPPDGNHEFAVY